MLAALLLVASVPAASADYIDISGHWAEQTMRRGVEDGLLVGDGTGRLNPNKNITLAEIVTILVRVMGTERAGDISGYNIPVTVWYRESASRGAALGLLSKLGTNPAFQNTPSRGEAFVIMAEAFQLIAPETSVACLEKFQDASQLNNQTREATATLVQMGLVQGSGTLLMSTRPITRAEFLTLLYRMIGSFQTADLVPAAPTGNLLIAPGAGGAVLEALSAGTSDVSAAVRGEIEADDALQTTDSETPDPRPENEALAGLPGEEAAPADDLAETGAVLASQAASMEETAEVQADLTANSANEAVLQNITTARRLIFNSACHEITLQNVKAQNDVLIRADQLDALNITGGTVINQLTLASLSGNITIAPEGDNRIETLRVGTGRGTVTVSGNVGRVEITGTGRHVELKNANLSSLVISGSYDQVNMFAGSTITTARTLDTAIHTRLYVDGQIGNMYLYGKDSQVSGIGFVGSVLIVGSDSGISTKYGSYKETIDRNLSEMHLTLQAPSVVKAGGSLTVNAKFTNVGLYKVCATQWYRDGVAVPGQWNSAFGVAEGTVTSYSPPITFSKNMKTSVTVGLMVSYTHGTKVDVISKTITVPIQNYPASHYNQSDINRVLNMVSCKFTGRRSDYTTADKETFVNAKGYSSPSKYLIWVNLATQRANIFQGSKGNWKLLRTGQVSTGKASTPTPVGVFKVTWKQTGWFASTYTVKPVVRFSAGNGYAFHSRLYYPNSTRLQDGTIGVPASHGCVRMMDPDIQWIYNNAPSGTTVVVY